MNINFSKPSNALGWFLALRRNLPEWYETSSRAKAHPKPWPARFNPNTDAVFSYNEIFLPGVTPHEVFAVLVTATNWPHFYPNSDAVQLPAGEKLQAGTVFRWKTFATAQQSTVELFEPDHALGWTAESFGVHAFHRWILEPQGHGTRVITEECQNGFVAWLVQRLMNPSLHATHQLWLKQLQSVVQPSPATVSIKQ